MPEETKQAAAGEGEEEKKEGEGKLRATFPREGQNPCFARCRF